MTPSVVAYAPKDGSAPCVAKPCFARRERVSKISMEGKFWIIKTECAFYPDYISAVC